MSDTPKLLLNYVEAAKALSISKSQLEKMKRRGEIPYVASGDRVLFDPDDLRNWIAKTKKVA